MLLLKSSVYAAVSAIVLNLLFGPDSRIGSVLFVAGIYAGLMSLAVPLCTIADRLKK